MKTTQNGLMFNAILAFICKRNLELSFNAHHNGAVLVGI